MPSTVPSSYANRGAREDRPGAWVDALVRRDTPRRDARVSVTLSLADAADASRAAHAAADAIAERGAGFTLGAPSIGGWQGSREYAYTLDIVGDLAHIAGAHACAAAIAAGCTCVQVETWQAGAYSVREVTV